MWVVEKKLPEGWRWTRLIEACIQITDGSHYSPKTVQDGMRYVTVRDIENGAVNLSTCKFISLEDYSNLVKANCSPNEGDILFSKDGTVGKVALVQSPGFVVLSSLAIIKPRIDIIDPEFLVYIMRSNGFMEQALGMKTGAAIKRVVLKNLKNIIFPLPPLFQQRHLVSTLKYIFTKLDAAIEKIEQNLKDAEAFIGSHLDQFFGFTEDTLPAGYEMRTVESLAEKIQYGYTGKALNKGEYHYLRITDIQDMAVEWDTVPFSDIHPEKARDYLLSEGDILFARSGATAGKSYLYEDGAPSVFASYLIRVVCRRRDILPAYLYFYFQSPTYWSLIRGLSSGAAQPNVNGTKLASILVPVPSVIQQENVVSTLKKIQERTILLKSKYQIQLNHLQALKKSILHAAFNGEL